MMEQKDLWQAFAQTGRVEDYLRYRGVSLADGRKDEGVGQQTETTSDNRRPHSAGL